MNKTKINNFFDLIVKYGRYDDLFVFFDTQLEKAMIKYVFDTLEQDSLSMEESDNISLLAKWMPSINTSSKKTRELAKRFIKAGNSTEKDYRKLLSELRKYIDVTERKTCANKWSEIDYETVSSQANLKYKNAFLKHDEERRKEYLNKLQKGEAKINSGVLFPHDIVHNYTNVGWNEDSVKAKDTALEEMWKALPDYVQGCSNTMVVRDGSGSMCVSIGNSSTRALDVATALAIYFSEHCEGQFKNNFITFGANPKLVSLDNYETLKDKMVTAYREADCSNTNIEKTFDLILQVAVNNKLKQEEIPNLLIISDQEFDAAVEK